VEQERAHHHKTAPRRNAGHLSQSATMRGNLVRGDAPEPMRPRNDAQGSVPFSAVVEMNANRNQLSQELSGRLAKPSALLLRPCTARRFREMVLDGDTQVLMQRDEPITSWRLGKVGALNCRVRALQEGCQTLVPPQFARQQPSPSKRQQLPCPGSGELKGCDLGADRGTLTLGQDVRGYYETLDTKTRRHLAFPFRHRTLLHDAASISYLWMAR
jgi:hypothetical protein